MNTVRIGSGAGYSGDRIEPAIELAEKGNIQYLVFECLAERTIAIAQQMKRKDPAKGYDPLLKARMDAVLGVCRARGITIITNMGAANPAAGALVVREAAEALGLTGIRVAVVGGDDVLEAVRSEAFLLEETGVSVASLGDRLVSVNAYLGAAPIVEALANGADVVLTGRVADPALYLAPLVHAFQWSMDDWPRLGQGTAVGHLLECAGQVTGGYFADPGVKDVPGLARLGFPLAEVDGDGQAVITKVPGSGGLVSPATCKEQLLYEIHDPRAYLTPDVVADFTNVTFTETAPDRVRVRGATGRRRPETLKVSVGYLDGFIGQGEISYAGPGAVARGRLALEIVAERITLIGLELKELRLELIGVDAIHGGGFANGCDPYEVRVRVAGRAESSEEAGRIGNEVEALYTNGPAGGGGASKSVKRVIAMGSTYIPRDLARPVVSYLEV